MRIAGNQECSEATLVFFGFRIAFGMSILIGFGCVGGFVLWTAGFLYAVRLLDVVRESGGYVVEGFWTETAGRFQNYCHVQIFTSSAACSHLTP